MIKRLIVFFALSPALCAPLIARERVRNIFAPEDPELHLAERTALIGNATRSTRNSVTHPGGPSQLVASEDITVLR